MEEVTEIRLSVADVEPEVLLVEYQKAQDSADSGAGLDRAAPTADV